ncbi:hypothetical protein A3A76_02555 [Candidatus Woesebacteria bacterium RIFCSPLOWO2_01_FULL_39_23]|uniref:Type II secretion system protein GspG C-terminal domain-containing protein n=1 Tax=Candidatus Woesebacteria bacterium RIFCSPHIGHO2_01_FULL_40_22 TaxID=1802499 RepID=A0A1F7YJB3_9BACT|nr:MAG: hypothetical protein A2141_01475 [Candidatus Woesebacteria bacterium RBG_16_40_11]OGM27357.1 MAG: hypothetical protein A2628_00960 [Candidatus Woesebacteria bacterium RIFCSPHIGHO2_01_FULL_40_22]OGM36946.1 MAG: hypothetical protein A3E41_05730 [Candidatus Woesebacteria bacterium RIFCSPHIGHO2_12_FULL_38_9]OGM62529.1 MAG: hypothetical protein A3A76_02555 [Candidatus Woesebacteria bacterium RIFCSPLOWO2_01_FULL_39_23]
MKPFTKSEIKGVSIILLVIFSVTAINLKVALRRARDAQRRDDVGALDSALNKYQVDFGFFPPSTTDGKILACKGPNYSPLPENMEKEERMKAFLAMLKGCVWGKDAFRDVNDDSYPPYIKILPADPKSDEGISYFYISNGNRFQIYTYLEGGDGEIGFRQGIVDRQLPCGNQICNFGRSYGATPLEKSIEEYENDILGK